MSITSNINLEKIKDLCPTAINVIPCVPILPPDVEVRYIRIDALKEKDIPNGINQNSIYLEFIIDCKNKKVELNSQGFVWLSEYDKTTEKYRYLCMRKMVSIAEECGIKKFRKQGYKTEEDLIKKITTYYNNVMDCVVKYTGGYPYKQGILNQSVGI